MLAAVDLGITDDSEGASHEQAAQIGSPCLLILPSLSRPPLECCFGTNPIQAEKLRPDRKVFGIANTCHQSGGQQRTDDRNAVEALARLIGAVPSHDHSIKV